MHSQFLFESFTDKLLSCMACGKQFHSARPVKAKLCCPVDVCTLDIAGYTQPTQTVNVDDLGCLIMHDMRMTDQTARRENAGCQWKAGRKVRPVMFKGKSPAWKIASPELYRWRQTWQHCNWTSDEMKPNSWVLPVFKYSVFNEILYNICITIIL